MFGQKKIPTVVKDAMLHLQPGEEMHHWTRGFCDVSFLGQKIEKNGAVIANEQRLLVYLSKSFGRYEVREFRFATITQFLVEKGFLGYSLKLSAAGSDCRISLMVVNAPEDLLQFVRLRIGGPHAAGPQWRHAPPPPPPPKDGGLVDELERLAALRQAGALNDEEFAAAKRKLIE